MNTLEKIAYSQQMRELIEGAVITDLKTEEVGEDVHLWEIKVKQANGDEFLIRPYNEKELVIIQTLWGELERD